MKVSRKNSLSSIPQSVRDSIRNIPDSPGVYLFYDASGSLIYIGKSKTLRKRVRSHFAAPEERAMCRKVSYIEIRKTVGELGALLLESQLIKELHPHYNRLSRHKRRIMVARRKLTAEGYTSVSLEPTTRIDPASFETILGIFKTKTQAREFLAASARTYRLCLNLIGLEHSRRSCFSFHLHQCNGACAGLEPPELYNPRVEAAFEERRIRSWPFPGAVIIEETDHEEGTSEVFVVDNWCLLYTFTVSTGKPGIRVRGIHQFDYDSYRILAGYIFNDANLEHVRPAGRNEINALLQKARAA